MRMTIRAAFLSFLALGLLVGSGLAQATEPSDSENNMNAQATSTSESQALTDPGQIYNDKTPGSWMGKSITFKNVSVQDTNDDGNFWVGADSDHRLLVVKSDNDPNMKAMRLHKGDVVTISGVVQAASKPIAEKTGASAGSMMDAMKGSGLFLLANNISIASSPQR
jgi:hypothetical protein